MGRRADISQVKDRPTIGCAPFAAHDAAAVVFNIMLQGQLVITFF
jgi:hypothetical protein